jgi:hypothetical protein
MAGRKRHHYAGALGLALLAMACDSGNSNGPDMSGADMAQFEPSAPSAYTAKVKNLLTGLPPSDAEVQAVNANPQALAGLIDQWMLLPEFQGKMINFFQQAFQQTQISEMEFGDQLGVNSVQAWNPTDKLKFLSSATTSFPLTALQIVNSGAPFTNAVTTDTFMLNIPMMAALAFNDMDVMDDNGSFVPGNLLKNYPNFQFTRTTAVVPIDQTLDPTNANFMVWTDPNPYTGPNANCATYPLTIDAKTTAHLANAVTFMGSRLFGGRPGCGSTTSAFTATDYSTWKMVKIRPPMPGEATTMPWELAKLRDPNTTTLVLNTPRIGFMTTLAFNANWPTNLSNLARVTTNQTLIVALGKTLADPSTAVPVTESGNMSAHAQPGTVCYVCHATLDPMRNFFRQSYSVSYHMQTLTLPADQATAEYNYDGLDIKGSGGGIKDLAQALIQSPSFAPAWTQKLCQFANSSSCSPDDPEFQRVATVFSQSNFNFKSLIRELFSSPLVTGASSTQTALQNGTVISVSRREHFCAAMSNRLGISDACQLLPTNETVIQDEAFGIPGSAYSRGTPSPLLPHDPDLFFYSAVENLCGQLAIQVIDQATCASPKHCWSSKQPLQSNVVDMVTLLMAAPPSDSRAADLAAILTDHYNQAIASGATATIALQSTFALACSSPLSEASGL